MNRAPEAEAHRAHARLGRAGTKAAIVVGSAAIIAGGGLAVRESRHDGVAEGRAGGKAAAALVADGEH